MEFRRVLFRSKLEVAAVAIVLVGAEQDLLAVGGESGGEAGAAEIRDGVGVRAIGIADHQLHFHGRGEVVGQQRLVSLHQLGGLGIIGAPDQLGAVAGVDRAAIVAGGFGELLLVGTERKKAGRRVGV